MPESAFSVDVGGVAVVVPSVLSKEMRGGEESRGEDHRLNGFEYIGDHVYLKYTTLVVLSYRNFLKS